MKDIGISFFAQYELVDYLGITVPPYYLSDRIRNFAYSTVERKGGADISEIQLNDFLAKNIPFKAKHLSANLYNNYEETEVISNN